MAMTGSNNTDGKFKSVFEAKVAAFEKKRGMVPGGSKVLVACSGGPDSMALLHWLITNNGKRFVNRCGLCRSFLTT